MNIIQNGAGSSSGFDWNKQIKVGFNNYNLAKVETKTIRIPVDKWMVGMWVQFNWTGTITVECKVRASYQTQDKLIITRNNVSSSDVADNYTSMIPVGASYASPNVSYMDAFSHIASMKKDALDGQSPRIDIWRNDKTYTTAMDSGITGDLMLFPVECEYIEFTIVNKKALPTGLINLTVYYTN